MTVSSTNNIVPFRMLQPAAPQPDHLELYDGFDPSRRAPVFGIFLVDADGSWIDFELFRSRAERDAEIQSWNDAWGILGTTV